MPENARFLAKVEKARGIVHSLDAIDDHQDRKWSTIISALEAGLRNPKSDAAFEAYVMLLEKLSTENYCD